MFSFGHATAIKTWFASDNVVVELLICVKETTQQTFEVIKPPLYKTAVRKKPAVWRGFEKNTIWGINRGNTVIVPVVIVGSPGIEPPPWEICKPSTINFCVTAYERHRMYYFSWALDAGTHPFKLFVEVHLNFLQTKAVNICGGLGATRQQEINRFN